MKRKARAVILAAVVVTIAVVSFLIKPAHPSTNDVGAGAGPAGPIKIGVILPLTGDAADYGTGARQGMELAFKELERAGGRKGRRLVPVYEDSRGDPKMAVTAFEKLVDLDKVPAVLGPMTSSEVLSVAPIAERRKIVVLTPTASAPAISHAGDYIFRSVTSDLFDGRVMARFACGKLGLRTASVCYVNNDFGLGLKQAFEDEFKRLGGKIAVAERLSGGSTDFRTQIEKVKESKAQAVYVICGKEIGRFLKQATELALKAQFLSISVFEDPEILSVAGQAAEGAYYTYRTYDPAVPEGPVASFVQNYKSTFKRPPDLFAALSYDAVKILAAAIASQGVSSDQIKLGLYNIKNFPGVTGNTTFDTNGDVIKPVGIKMLKQGKFVWVEKPE